MSIRTIKASILRPGWKSGLDIACILLSLPVWLPLMILLMLVTRIASPGPIFYRQERVGFGGRHFFIWKFRTMKLSAETQAHERHFEELIRVDCPMTKLDAYGDPRLAPFGRILRASGLDELPQIFNVLRGEMSLVGPRPCLPNEFARYEPWQRERVNGLPGLTGYWQVNGKNNTTFNEMIAMDLFYLKNMSILLDLKIMLKTGAVIAGQLFESQQAARRSRQNGSRRSPTTTILHKNNYAQRAPSDVMFCEMADELRNLRVHNRLSSQLLSRLLDLRHWSELELAKRSGITRSLVSAHLSGQHPIRSQHLAAYLRVLDRQERAAFLSTWLRDNLDHELITDLLDGTKTDSMSAPEENRRRMLDWWATAIARDSKLAKTFSYLTTGFQFPSVLLLPVSTAAAQLESWLLGKASSVGYLVRSLCSRLEHAAVAVVTLLLALCQQGKVTQQAGELAGGLAEKAVATSLVATSFVAPALAETTDFGFDLGDASPPAAIPNIRKGKVASRAIAKRSPRRAQPKYQVDPALRVEKTIYHEWRRLVAARKSVHSAFARLIRDAHPQQSKQKHRKQRRS
jgi:lipopolysaccharide/colanic/teichoic acid biosynthesis glycosyltransferase/transcriptional regulator with XRE-family HTH domain